MTKTQLRMLANNAQLACDDLRDALQEHFDGKSEKWQDSDAGQELQEVLDELEHASVAFDSAISWL